MFGAATFFIQFKMEVVGKQIISIRQQIAATEAEIKVAELKIERVEGQIEDAVVEIKNVRIKIRGLTSEGDINSLVEYNKALYETVHRFSATVNRTAEKVKRLAEDKKQLREKELFLLMRFERLRSEMPVQTNGEFRCPHVRHVCLCMHVLLSHRHCHIFPPPRLEPRLPDGEDASKSKEITAQSNSARILGKERCDRCN